MVLSTFRFFDTGRACSFFTTPRPLLFEATMPRLNARSDARDGGAPTSDIRTRRPALEPRVSASACTDLRGNAMRWGSAIRKWCFLVVRTKNHHYENEIAKIALKSP